MNSRAIVLTALLYGLFALGFCAHAQQAAPKAYDVSTVRPAAPGKGGMMLNWGSGELRAENVTLEWIMTSAFHARTDQISNEPDWAKDKHFDINAKLTDIDSATLKKLTPDQHRALLLALLIERFGLKYHEETKVLPTYDLVAAKNGLKLTPAVVSDDKSKEVNGACDGCTYWGNNEVRAHDIDMTSFAEMLGGQLGRNVHDGTGYTAKIDVNLKWAPDVGAQPASDDDASLLPLPQMLERQMGLHLAPTKGPVKLFIVDNLDQPSDN